MGGLLPVESIVGSLPAVEEALGGLGGGGGEAPLHLRGLRHVPHLWQHLRSLLRILGVADVRGRAVPGSRGPCQGGDPG